MDRGEDFDSCSGYEGPAGHQAQERHYLTWIEWVGLAAVWTAGCREHPGTFCGPASKWHPPEVQGSKNDPGQCPRPSVLSLTDGTGLRDRGRQRPLSGHSLRRIALKAAVCRSQPAAPPLLPAPVVQALKNVDLWFELCVFVEKVPELGLPLHKGCIIGKCINQIFANQIVF